MRSRKTVELLGVCGAYHLANQGLRAFNSDVNDQNAKRQSPFTGDWQTRGDKGGYLATRLIAAVPKTWSLSPCLRSLINMLAIEINCSGKVTTLTT